MSLGFLKLSEELRLLEQEVKMTDFQKIIDHPEKTIILSKLLGGEDPKVVSKYLKDKFAKDDESHLRIPSTVLQEFLGKYANHHAYVKKIINKNADSKLDKKIADSLMDTREWRERIVDGVKKEINYLDKLDMILTVLETRSEQLFDLIQSDPENTRTDYIFTKYMEQLMLVIEKADKLKNDKPDIRIEHTYSVQMVEQQSVAFQEAIRRVLDRLGPEYTSLFMELLSEELNKLNPNTINPVPTPKQIEQGRKDFDKIEQKVLEFDKEFEEKEENAIE
jgi:hypothetical protein